MGDFISKADRIAFGLDADLARSDAIAAVIEYDVDRSYRALKVISALNLGKFDASTLSAYGNHPELRQALGFLNIRMRRGAYFDHATTARVRRWLDWASGRDLGSGLMLTRDAIGWCYVREVEPRRRGPRWNDEGRQ
jgi:hypothetical protein